MNLPFFIARRYLVKQKGTFSSFIIRLSIVATCLSVAVMIVAMAIINGFKHTIREKMYSFVGHVHVDVYDENRSQYLDQKPIQYDDQLVAHIAHMPGVQQVAPFVVRPAIIQAHGEMDGIQLKGVGSNFHFLKGIGFSGSKINYSDTAYSKEILLSQSTADRLNVNTGDTVHLYFLESGATFPRIRKVVVAGLYHTGVEEVDKYYALCDIRLLQHINGWQPDEVNGYQVDLSNEQYTDTVYNGIHDYLRSPQYIGKSMLDSYNIMDLYPSMFDWLNMQDVNSRIILIIMSIVAVINLATGLMILIVDQARMVGMMKALGMTLGGMRRIFLYYSGLIAAIGIIAGNVLAVGICVLQQKTGFLKLNENTYYMKYVPVRFHWWQVAAIDAVTLLLCVLCMWLPTLYIRKIQPVKVLQFK